MNLFQRSKAQSEEKIEPPAAEPALLPKGEKSKATDTVQPIHVDDAQYLQLTRALRPSVAPVLKDCSVDVPESNAPGVMGGAGQSPPANIDPGSPEPPPGAPIV